MDGQGDELMLSFLACCATGVSVAGLLYCLAGVILRPLPSHAENWQFEDRRREALRARSLTYRLFESFIEDLARSATLLRIGRSDRVDRILQSGLIDANWDAPRWIAATFVEGVVMAAFVSGTSVGLIGVSTAILLFALFPPLYLRFQAMRWETRRVQRQKRFKFRLPYAIDLLALMIESGATLREALSTIARESADHPIGEEFRRIQVQMNCGQPFRRAIEELGERIQDEEVSELVRSVSKSQELGTPLGKTLLMMAEQVRLRHSQWAEKVAGKAQTTIIFPGTLIMIACMVIIVAPFILRALEHY